MQVAVAESFAAFDIVVVTASAGGIQALISFLNALPSYFPAPIIVAQHLAPCRIYRSRLEHVLQHHTKLRVKWAEAGEMALPGIVYLAPQDGIAVLDSQNRTIQTISKLDCVKGILSGNSLFQSAAITFGNRALAIILSGVLSDGADGAADIARFGGRILAQSYGSCAFADMPRAAMKCSGVALAFDPVGLAQAVMALVVRAGAKIDHVTPRERRDVAE